MAQVLVVDDDPSVVYTVGELLLEHGHQTVQAVGAADALQKLDGVDAVITDFEMGEVNGLELLALVRDRDSELPVILLTAHGSERLAVKAMKAGAYDYLAKPFDADELSVCVERALETRRLRTTNRRLAAERAVDRRIVAESAAMRSLLRLVERVGPRPVTVLLRGETGTGKELVAALLHAHSGRADGPLIRFNAAAIPAELAEAELFGHTRGAFTGAVNARRGFFGEADGGTLIIDEIGELPLSVQAKLLRVLQNGEVQPVGAGKVDRVDVRVVASTHRDLAAEIRAGRFREDLYYRLAVVELVVPALSVRREDIAPLAREFARRCGERFGLETVALAPELLVELEGRPWPGNVRQLENTVARLVALSAGGTIGLGALVTPHLPEADEPSPSPGAEGAPSLREQVEAFERNLLAGALRAAGGNQSETARRLRIGRATLLDKLKKHRLM